MRCIVSCTGKLTTKDQLFIRHNARMHSDFLYHRHRFPAEIVSHFGWLYFRFVLSFRDVEGTLRFISRPRHGQAAIGSQIRSVLEETTALGFLE